MTLESPDFPFLPLRLVISGYSIEVTTLIDTGFDGQIVLPVTLVPPELDPIAFQALELADGTELEAPAFSAMIYLGDFEPIVGSVYALGDEPLVGLGVIARYRVILDHGQRVIVEP